jgi:hypothetical protein
MGHRRRHVGAQGTAGHVALTAAQHAVRVRAVKGQVAVDPVAVS